MTSKPVIQTVLIDFGGVLAEEGFLMGLRSLASSQGLDPDRFFRTVEELIVETGYLTGAGYESFFWDRVRERTGIRGKDEELRQEVLKRFIIRQEMLAIVDGIRSRGIPVVLLSDQTNWLEEIDRSTGLYGHFDRVFNSYRTHKSKQDPSVFRDVCTACNVDPRAALFIDDNAHHIERAEREGLQTILFRDVVEFRKRISGYIDLS